MNEQSTFAKVEQADRDAAADIYRRFRYGATVEIQAKIRREIERGDRDTDPIVQAFARYRQADLSAAKNLREALESIAANGCCNSCQEAALVARAALSPHHRPHRALGSPLASPRRG